MQSVVVSFVVRTPEEALCRPYLDPLPAVPWVEVGDLRAEGVPAYASKAALRALAEMVRASCRGHRVYCLCAAHHGRTYAGSGDWRLVRSGISFRSDDDWLLELIDRKD